MNFQELFEPGDHVVYREKGVPKPLDQVEEKVKTREELFGGRWVIIMRDFDYVNKKTGAKCLGKEFVGTRLDTFLERYQKACEAGKHLAMYAFTNEELHAPNIQLQVDLDCKWREGAPLSASSALQFYVGALHEALQEELESTLAPPVVYTCHRWELVDDEPRPKKFSFHVHYTAVRCESQVVAGELMNRVRRRLEEEGKEMVAEGVDGALYRSRGWFRLPGSRKLYADGTFSPPLERATGPAFVDNRQELSFEVAFPHFLDPDPFSVTSELIPVPEARKAGVKRKRREVCESVSSSGEGIEDTIKEAIRMARPWCTDSSFLLEVRHIGDNKYYIHILAGGLPCLFNHDRQPHASNNMRAYLQRTPEGRRVLLLRCYDKDTCQGKTERILLP